MVKERFKWTRVDVDDWYTYVIKRDYIFSEFSTFCKKCKTQTVYNPRECKWRCVYCKKIMKKAIRKKLKIIHQLYNI
jgi:tRNA(Ile2) C34 agmatinyltransferase TiaS